MASFLKLRRKPSALAGGFRTFRGKLVVTALLLAAAVTAFALSELAAPQGNHAVHSTPGFLTRALGAPRPTASLVRTPAPHVTVKVDNNGLTVADSAGAVEIGRASCRERV